MTETLTADDTLRLRLAAQGLTRPLATPAAVADRLYALQGQDSRAVRHALAARTTAGDTLTGLAAVSAAFDAGELVRSWPMRGTLFVSSPTALATLLALTAERVFRSMTTRRERLGITDTILERARNVALETVTDAGVSRADLRSAWEEAGISTADGLGYHLVVQLAIAGELVFGPVDGNDYLLVPWTAPALPDDHDALLARAVAGYLAGHGPATVDDVAWWTKLPKGQIRRGAAAAGDTVTAVEVDGREYLATAAALDSLGECPPLDDTIRLLPAFDEWYLGYQDRSLTATPGLDEVIVPGRNGVFRPIVVVGARTVGTWRRTKVGAEISDLADPVSKRVRSAIDAALAAVD